MDLKKIESSLSLKQQIDEEIERLKTDYAPEKMIVTDETLLSIKDSFKTVRSKRIELETIQKNGVSEIAKLSRDWKTVCSKGIEELKACENGISSQVNAFQDDKLYSSAKRKNTIEAYSAYLKKYDSLKFEYKGKFITEAKEAIKIIENEAKQKLFNFESFKSKYSMFNTYKTSEDAVIVKNELLNMQLTAEEFGEKVHEAEDIKLKVLQNLVEVIAHLIKREEEEAESKRKEAIQARINQQKSYLSNLLSSATLQTIDDVIEKIKAVKVVDFDDMTAIAEADKTQALNTAIFQKQNLEQAEENRIIKEEQDKKERELREREEEQSRKDQEEKDRKAKEEKEFADRKAELERQRLENERKEKELEELRKEKEAQEREEERLNEIDDRGMIEINGNEFDKNDIQDVLNFYDDNIIRLSTLSKDSISNVIAVMREQEALGKKHSTDLTDEQRANLKAIEEAKTYITLELTDIVEKSKTVTGLIRIDLLSIEDLEECARLVFNNIKK